MVVKVKEKDEKTRNIKNNDNFEKYNLRGQKNARYHDRILSKERKSFIYNSTFFCIYNLYTFKVCQYTQFLSFFSKIVIDMRFEPSEYTKLLSGYRMMNHTLFQLKFF